MSKHGKAFQDSAGLRSSIPSEGARTPRSNSVPEFLDFQVAPGMEDMWETNCDALKLDKDAKGGNESNLSSNLVHSAF